MASKNGKKTSEETEAQLWPMGAVTRRTGIGEHTLRAWERRFGFPAPHRLDSGHRRYPADQVQQLMLINAALNCGYRAGDVVPLGRTELEDLLRDCGALDTGTPTTIYLFNMKKGRILEYRLDVVEPKLRELTAEEEDMVPSLTTAFEQARTGFVPRVTRQRFSTTRKRKRPSETEILDVEIDDKLPLDDFELDTPLFYPQEEGEILGDVEASADGLS